MGKKKKAIQSQPLPKKPGINFENSRYYVPVVFGIMLLALVMLFGDFLFSDKMLYGSDMLNAGVYHRGMLVDHVIEYGKIPQWNPHAFGGMPYVEAFHGDIFYPFSVMKFFVSLYFHLGFNLILHIFFAGVFMYLAARQFKLSKTAALFSAASYMFAHYLVSMIAPGHEGKIYVTALFPLVILFLDRAFEKNPFFNFTILGMIIGIIIVSPHPQMSYFTLWAVALYSLYKLILLFIKSRDFSKVLKPSLLVTYAVVLGLLLSAIQFYPGYIYTTEFSPRADTKKGWDWATSWSLHEEEVFSQIIPEFAGTSSRTAETVYWGKNAFKDNAETVGVVPLFLALIGMFFARRRERYFFGGLALFALLYGLGATTPIFKIFYWLIPKVSSLRAPSMIMFFFAFSVSLLAGMGIQKIIEWKNYDNPELRKKLYYILFGFPAFLFVLALLFGTAGNSMLSIWSSFFYSEASTTFVGQGVSKLDLAYRNLPAIQSGAWFGFLFTSLAALFIWLYLTGRAGITIISALVLLPIVDGARFNGRFIDVVDPDNYFKPNQVTNFFTQQEGKFRVLNLTREIPKMMLPLFGIEVVTGYHGNQLRWYDDLLGGPQLRNLTNARFLNLIGTKYLLLASNMALPQGFMGEKPVTDAISFGSVKVMKNENALERVFLVNQYRVISERKQIVTEVLQGGYDLGQLVYLEEEPPLEISSDSMLSDSAWIIEHQFDSVVIGVNCTANRILVLTENYYDSWHIFVDNQPAKLLRADGSFRAVAIPAGAKQVIMIFESERYATGKLITLSSLLYLLIIFGFFFWQGRKVNREELDGERDS